MSIKMKEIRENANNKTKPNYKRQDDLEIAVKLFAKIMFYGNWKW